jgi:hypothetical protein
MKCKNYTGTSSISGKCIHVNNLLKNLYKLVGSVAQTAHSLEGGVYLIKSLSDENSVIESLGEE